MKHKADRFWSLVSKSDGCWTWTGHVSPDGYGKYSGNKASRAAYRIAVGEIPEGLQLDHLCRNILCVRPDHLEPVTDLENKRRRYADYTHCIHGHEFTEENTRIGSDGRRHCRACARARSAAYAARKRAAA